MENLLKINPFTKAGRFMYKIALISVLILSACSKTPENKTDTPVEPDQVLNLDTVNGISYLVSDLDQSIINLGQVITGQRAKSTVVIRNIGSAPTPVASATVSANYFISSSTCSNKSLLVGSSCSLTINFSSVQKSLGVSPGTLTFGASSIGLTAEVVAKLQPPAPNLIMLDSNNQSVSSPVDLLSHSGNLTLAKTFKIKNIGTSASPQLSLQLIDNNLGWYIISNSCSSVVLNAGQECSFVLRVSTRNKASGVYSVKIKQGDLETEVKFTKNGGPAAFPGYTLVKDINEDVPHWADYCYLNLLGQDVVLKDYYSELYISNQSACDNSALANTNDLLFSDEGSYCKVEDYSYTGMIYRVDKPVGAGATFCSITVKDNWNNVVFGEKQVGKRVYSALPSNFTIFDNKLVFTRQDDVNMDFNVNILSSTTGAVGNVSDHSSKMDILRMVVFDGKLYLLARPKRNLANLDGYLLYKMNSLSETLSPSSVPISSVVSGNEIFVKDDILLLVSGTGFYVLKQGSSSLEHLIHNEAPRMGYVAYTPSSYLKSGNKLYVSNSLGQLDGYPIDVYDLDTLQGAKLNLLLPPTGLSPLRYYGSLGTLFFESASFKFVFADNTVYRIYETGTLTPLASFPKAPGALSVAPVIYALNNGRIFIEMDPGDGSTSPLVLVDGTTNSVTTLDPAFPRRANKILDPTSNSLMYMDYQISPMPIKLIDMAGNKTTVYNDAQGFILEEGSQPFNDPYKTGVVVGGSLYLYYYSYASGMTLAKLSGNTFTVLPSLSNDLSVDGMKTTSGVFVINFNESLFFPGNGNDGRARDVTPNGTSESSELYKFTPN